nr:basic salivary proline-rich protein 3 [Loxodonta africana]
MTPCKLCPWIKLLSHGILQEDEPGVPGEGERFGNLQRSESPAAGCPHHGAKGDRASLFPLGALGRLEVYDQAGNPRDSRLEARRRDSDRGSREEEPEVAAGGSGPSEGRAKGCSGPGRRREVGVTPVWKVMQGRAAAPFEGREKGLSQSSGMGGKGPEGARSLHPGEEAAGGSRSADAEPPRPGAEHAAPACCPRVHPAQRGGDRAEAVAPGRCLGPDPLHVSPARGHVHRSTRFGARTSSARPEPAGQVAAPPRPRPPAPPRRSGGALPQSLIKKVAKLTLPKVVACAPLSLPALYSLKHD